MKIIYLLPPSEGKNSGGELGFEKLSFNFSKPIDIAINATEKDLKCKGSRYKEGIELNKKIQSSPSVPLNGGGSEQSEQGELLPAVERYSGVMYNAIDYAGMSEEGKKYFENNFKIFSGMYGLLRPLDSIGNYKLPIETKGLYTYWGEQITEAINDLKADYVVDLLPISYAKMINWRNLNATVVRINFLHSKNGELKKISHGVKKIKGEYIKKLCERGINTLEEFDGEKVQISENEYHINVISK